MVVSRDGEEGTQCGLFRQQDAQGRMHRCRPGDRGRRSSSLAGRARYRSVKPRGRSGSAPLRGVGGAGAERACPSRVAVGVARGSLGGGHSQAPRFRFRFASAPAARRAAMAYSTLQRVALASGVVLAVSLLLPKVFLSRGKRQEPAPAPGGKRGPLPRGAGIPATWRDGVRLESPVPTCTAAEPAGEGRPAAFGGCQAPQCPWRHWAGAPLAPLPCALCPRRSLPARTARSHPALGGACSPAPRCPFSSQA